MTYTTLWGPCITFAMAMIALQLEPIQSPVAIDLYDVNKREIDGNTHYSMPYGEQENYFLDPARGQYFREPTGKRTGYYTVPRGKTTYQQGRYDRGRFYVQPNTSYPGDKPYQEE